MTNATKILQQNARKIACIGFGEAAQAFAKGWSGEPEIAVSAYDIRLDDPAAASEKWRDFDKVSVAGHTTLASLLTDADIVFSLVTADQASAAAHAAAAHLRPGAIYFDGNSCAPKTKQKNAEVVQACGARYVDAAIMSPVHPKLHRAPVLLCGPHAKTAQAALESFGMDAQIVPGPIGRASSIKMIRSIMVKGLEALTAECYLAARLAGVEDKVMHSLAASKTGIGEATQVAYNLERMMVHGQRRAAEMREVAITVTDLGLPEGMATATAGWQQLIGDLSLGAGGEDFKDRTDRILNALNLPFEVKDMK